MKQKPTTNARHSSNSRRNHFFAIADDLGQAGTKLMLNVAWQTLLLNHAHDSICGCSIDQVLGI